MVQKKLRIRLLLRNNLGSFVSWLHSLFYFILYHKSNADVFATQFCPHQISQQGASLLPQPLGFCRANKTEMIAINLRILRQMKRHKNPGNFDRAREHWYLVSDDCDHVSGH